ncbi:hypothetical protein M405DRAFT_220709 [Rhizopogon salebrosus TDB-379]|nr:hypothetical protein M405DRAFT_220709 [Rhizopogon salebrosus TDB-379]
MLTLNYCIVSHAVSHGHLLATPYTCLQSRRILAPPITRSPAITSTTVRTRSVSISARWPIHAGHASSPIVDVHLPQGQEVRAVTFHCHRNFTCSATLQRVLLKVTEATDTMKILIPIAFTGLQSIHRITYKHRRAWRRPSMFFAYRMASSVFW